MGPALSVGAQTGRGTVVRQLRSDCGSTEKGVWPGGRRRRPNTLRPGASWEVSPALPCKPPEALATEKAGGDQGRSYQLNRGENGRPDRGQTGPEVQGQLAAELVLDPMHLTPATSGLGVGLLGQVLTGVCPGVLESSLSRSSGQGCGRRGPALQTGLEHGADRDGTQSLDCS